MTFINAVNGAIAGLGNNSSLAPIVFKDIVSDAATVTTYAVSGGEHDAKERFIEEYGTGVLWLGGIPFIKKIFDKTVYKANNIDSGFDIRKLKKGASDSIEFSVEKLKKSTGKTAKDQLEALERITKNQGLTKGLFLGKFAVATTATMLGLGALITYKQKNTEKAVEAEYRKKVADKIKKEGAMAAFSDEVQNKEVTSMFRASLKGDKDKKSNDPSFGSIGNFMSGFMYNPVMNMSLLDGAITGTRMVQARKGERDEVLSKEAFQIAFIYLLAEPIKKGFELLTEKAFGKVTTLDYDLMNSEELEKSLKDGTLEIEIEKFNKKFGKAEEPPKKSIGEFFNRIKDSMVQKPITNVDIAADREVFNFVYDESDNILVKLLKESSKVATVSEFKETDNSFLKALQKIGIGAKKSTGEIDSLVHMDASDIKGTVGKFDELIQNIKAKGGIENLSKHMSQIKKMKAASILLNIAIGTVAIGVAQPLLNIFKREKLGNGDKTNPAIRELEKEVEKKSNFAFKGETFSKGA